MESKGRNKNKNQTEKFVQSIHKLFNYFKSNTKPKKIIFDFHFFDDYSSILSYKSF